MKLLVLLLLMKYIVTSPELIVSPVSRNVTIGSNVEFSCGTNDSSLKIIWFYTAPVTTQTNVQLPGGGFVATVHLTAHGEYNGSTFSCYLSNKTIQIDYKEALLLIQGDYFY